MDLEYKLMFDDIYSKLAEIEQELREISQGIEQLNEMLK